MRWIFCPVSSDVFIRLNYRILLFSLICCHCLLVNGDIFLSIFHIVAPSIGSVEKVLQSYILRQGDEQVCILDTFVEEKKSIYTGNVVVFYLHCCYFYLLVEIAYDKRLIFRLKLVFGLQTKNECLNLYWHIYLRKTTSFNTSFSRHLMSVG